MSIGELFSKSILQSKSMIDMHLADFSDADMMFRPAKSANHAIWQMGHLANSVRGMVTGCDPSAAFPFEDDPRFGKSKAGFDDASQFPSKAELIGRFEGREGLYALQSGPGFTRRLGLPPFHRLAARVLAFADNY